jgi:hypothetical protein
MGRWTGRGLPSRSTARSGWWRRLERARRRPGRGRHRPRADRPCCHRSRGALGGRTRDPLGPYRAVRGVGPSHQRGRPLTAAHRGAAARRSASAGRLGYQTSTSDRHRTPTRSRPTSQADPEIASGAASVAAGVGRWPLPRWRRRGHPERELRRCGHDLLARRRCRDPAARAVGRQPARAHNRRRHCRAHGDRLCRGHSGLVLRRRAHHVGGVVDAAVHSGPDRRALRAGATLPGRGLVLRSFARPEGAGRFRALQARPPRRATASLRPRRRTMHRLRGQLLGRIAKLRLMPARHGGERDVVRRRAARLLFGVRRGPASPPRGDVARDRSGPAFSSLRG